jgi:hypothetical protein
VVSSHTTGQSYPNIEVHYPAISDYNKGQGGAKMKPLQDKEIRFQILVSFVINFRYCNGFTVKF